MIIRDLNWLRSELERTIREGEESVFIHEKIWEILTWDDINGETKLERAANYKKLSILIGKLKGYTK